MPCSPFPCRHPGAWCRELKSPPNVLSPPPKSRLELGATRVNCDQLLSIVPGNASYLAKYLFYWHGILLLHHNYLGLLAVEATTATPEWAGRHHSIKSGSGSVPGDIRRCPDKLPKGDLPNVISLNVFRQMSFCHCVFCRRVKKSKC